MYRSKDIVFLSSLALLAAVVAHSGLYAKSGAASEKGNAGVSNSRQMLVVTTGNWNDVHGLAQRYERSSLTSKWHPVGASFPVVVGKAGLGWGRGIQPGDRNVKEGPSKHEGDGRAPAGIFPITNSFGYSSAPVSGARLPYVALNPSIECVDDASSHYYNRLIDSRDVRKDWNSFEQMRREDELYRWGAFVAQNSDPVAPSAGSCIFLHVWDGPDQGTAGCTAMDPGKIKSLLRWFDPDKRPVLVQLPESEYSLLAASWLLPSKAH